MSRSIDSDERDGREEKREGSGSLEGPPRSGGGEARPRVRPEGDEPKGFGENRRVRIVVREKAYWIRPSEKQVLKDLGTFRLIRDEDLVKGVHGGERNLADSDLRSLKRQGLIRSITFQGLRKDGEAIKVHMMTAAGHSLLERTGLETQCYRCGVVQRTEVGHESLLYRAYLRERGRIEAKGGSIKGVVLDHELKRKHFAKTGVPGPAYRALQAESARELNLTVIDGHVVFPDFRVEYENEVGERASVDVEVATPDYREKHLAMKLAAGFQVYSSSPNAGGRLQVDYGHNLQSQAFPRHTRMVLPL